MQEQIRYFGKTSMFGHCWIVDRSSLLGFKHSMDILNLDQIVSGRYMGQYLERALDLVPDLPQGLTLKEKLALLMLEK